MNGISVIGDKVGETMFYGAGVGGDATASAVVANIIDIAKEKVHQCLDLKINQVKITLMAKDDIQN